MSFVFLAAAVAFANHDIGQPTGFNSRGSLARAPARCKPADPYKAAAETPGQTALKVAGQGRGGNGAAGVAQHAKRARSQRSKPAAELAHLASKQVGNKAHKLSIDIGRSPHLAFGWPKSSCLTYRPFKTGRQVRWLAGKAPKLWASRPSEPQHSQRKLSNAELAKTTTTCCSCSCSCQQTGPARAC